MWLSTEIHTSTLTENIEYYSERESYENIKRSAVVAALLLSRDIVLKCHWASMWREARIVHQRAMSHKAGDLWYSLSRRHVRFRQSDYMTENEHNISLWSIYLIIYTNRVYISIYMYTHIQKATLFDITAGFVNLLRYVGGSYLLYKKALHLQWPSKIYGDNLRPWLWVNGGH